MAYLRIPEASNSLAGSGCDCGPSCGCGPCRKQHSGLGEWYIRDDDEEEEPERIPPPPAAAPAAPPPTPEPTPAKQRPGRQGRRRGRGGTPPPPNLNGGWGLHGFGCGCTAQPSMNRRPPGPRLGGYGWHDGGLGAFTIPADCCAWDKDRKSLASSVAQHYVVAELKKSLKPTSVWCSEVDPVCYVYFPGKLEVHVLFYDYPKFITVVAKDHPKRDYDFQCTGNVALNLSPHSSK